MTVISLSTDVMPPSERAESWRDFISRTIHNVSVERISAKDFSARISARQHDGIRCASFWTKAHDVCGKRETLGNAGASGYLVSWQMEGTAEITHDEQRRILVRPGDVTIIDSRRPMKVCFPGSVRRIVANLPAAAVEKSLPVLQHVHSMPLAPAEPFATILQSYLVELSTGNHALKLGDGDLLVENICNLLRVIAHRQDVYMTPRELQRAAIARFVSRHASNPDLSLDDAAAHLRMSSRLIQKVLHEQDSSFSNLLLQERLELARTQLLACHDRISSIAYSCGFNDISHFNHAFRKRFGMTPSDLRSAESAGRRNA